MSDEELQTKLDHAEARLQVMDEWLARIKRELAVTEQKLEQLKEEHGQSDRE